MSPLPTFLILGAQKCGTTTLHALLSQHPEICMSEPKETNFFNVHYEKGLEYYSRTFFRDWQGQEAVGESSPPYFFLPYVPRRLARDLPDVKMVIILRNPVKRAFSHWWMNTTFGLEKLSFKAAIEKSLTLSREDMEKARMCENFYLQAGYYAEQLKRYLEYFPRDRFHIIFSDDLKRDTEGTLRGIAGFIGVTPMEMPEDTVNRLESLGPFAAKIRRILRYLSMDNVIPPKFGYAVRSVFRRFGDHPPTLDDEMNRWMTNHYRPHNLALQEMLDIDLGEWGI